MTDAQKLEVLIEALREKAKETCLEVFCECCGPETVSTEAALFAETILMEVGEWKD